MPIRFRCPHCDRLLGIARRKAGTQTNCPMCGKAVTVPTQDGPEDLSDLDNLLNPAAGEAARPGSGPTPRLELPAEEDARALAAAPRSAAPAVAARPPAARPAAKPAAPKPGETPLFENDVDEMLGLAKVGEKLDLDDAPPTPKAKPVSGMDAMSLDDGGGKLVLTPQKATLLVVAVVVLLGLAFASGFLIASKM